MVHVLSETVVRGLLRSENLLMPRSIIEVNRYALQSLSHTPFSLSRSEVPPRTIVRYKPPDPDTPGGDTLFKPAILYGGLPVAPHEDLLGIKVVSVRNSGVPASTSLYCPATGSVRALVASTYLTAVRTAAGSAVALGECLRRRHISYGERDDGDDIVDHCRGRRRSRRPRLVVFGAGLQAEQHVRAALTALAVFSRPAPLEVEVTVINRSRMRAEQLRATLLAMATGSSGGNDMTVRLACVKVLTLEDAESEIEDRIASAVRRAHVILLGTGASVPVFRGEWMDPDLLAMICGAGSYTPDDAEVDEVATNQCSSVWIDSEAAREVGDLRGCCNRAVLLADVLSGRIVSSDGDSSLKTVFYKAVGTAVQDVSSSELMLRMAKERKAGLYVDMS
uniref:Ornithine cyclodeaminase n=1 Tax=Corethron hystrix TaxID=216773 RepID=A0A6U5GSP3_9STRA|mmetsp:Transcript_27960/g.64012  ORF Transcript_27960/g.64012 Transcript_27960/m.64012 type:complete len:393 (+) Transcript_27960:89-1267(+)